MSVRLPKASIASAARGGKAAFHVVIAYEDFAACQRALDACKILVSQLGGEVEFRSGMWKFEILRNSKLNQIAAEDAAAGDVLIVATSHGGELPAEVKRWIEGWIPQKRGQTAVLLALLAAPAERDATPWVAHEFLRDAAARARIDFLPQSFPGEESPVSGNAYPSAKPAGWSDRVIGRPAPEGWGLND